MAGEKKITFALAGNPNCGKTTLFNNLTGSTAHVGNWPGVTVEKREGTYRNKKIGIQADIVDLPGIYSLSPYTSEEVISRNYILEEHPDAVINVVDATNLERNLYLTTQILEMDVPVIVALNMSDLVKKQGDYVDAKLLSKKLGVPVVEISALRGENLDSLMEEAMSTAKNPRKGSTVLEGTKVDKLIKTLEIALRNKEVENSLFHAIKLVEGDEIECKMHADLLPMVEEFRQTFQDELFGNDFEALIADCRYKAIAKDYSPAYHHKEGEKVSGKEKLSISDKIDKVLTNRWLGIPIFVVILFLIFHLVFSDDLLYLGAMGAFGEGLADPFAGSAWEGLFVGAGINSPGVILHNLVDIILNNLILGNISAGLESIGTEAWALSLICDGILSGIFAVIGFLPEILCLFLFFSILEDSGYMARVAFILDRIFRRFGISGRAFMPMIMGFGCSVPAMINTRTLADDREKTATIRVIPFFSCGAKLPILTGCAGAIVQIFGFPYADIITLSMYLLGVVAAIAMLLLMRHTTMRGDAAPFIMELPAYHLPQFKSLMVHLWDKTKHYIKKAFTIIFASTVLIWFLQSFTWNWTYISVELTGQSILASLGQLIQPLFTPLGFGSQLTAVGWVFAVGAITGLIAKENVTGTFAVLAAMLIAGTSTGDYDEVSSVVAMINQTGITWQGVIAFVAFNMLTIPCFAACATAKAELPKGKFRWTLLFWLGSSYVISSMVYIVLSWWWTLFIFLAAILIMMATIWYINQIRDGKRSLPWRHS